MRPGLQALLKRHASTQSAAIVKPKQANSLPRVDSQKLFKTYKPVSPGIRHLRRPIQDHLHKGKPLRFLTEAMRKSGGRNNTGRVTVRGIGGGHRRRYRLVDFKRLSSDEYKVVRLEYDPNRSAHIALVQKAHSKGALKSDFAYILATDGLKPGDTVRSFVSSAASTTAATATPAPKGKRAYSAIPQELQDALLRSSSLQPGNVLLLKDMPLGQPIHSISLRPGGPAKLVRAAGTSAAVTAVGERWASVKLASGEVRQVHRECTAVLGAVSNQLWATRSLGKAGRARWLGRRPKVRGVAMNAVDHPHGGGRGKSKGNKAPRSPTGVLAKGFRTRRPGPRGNRRVVHQRPRGKQKSA